MRDDLRTGMLDCWIVRGPELNPSASFSRIGTFDLKNIRIFG
jgi:hypothetical protein